jgi:hypothetical protein
MNRAPSRLETRTSASLGHVGEVGDAGEHAVAAGQLEPARLALHHPAALQRHDQQLVAAAGEAVGGAGAELQHPQAAVGPAGLLGGDDQRPGPVGGRPRSRWYFTRSLLEQADRGVDRRGDVVVGRVQQRPADDQALDGGELEGLAPALEGRVLGG